MYCRSPEATLIKHLVHLVFSDMRLKKSYILQLLNFVAVLRCKAKMLFWIIQ